MKSSTLYMLLVLISVPSMLAFAESTSKTVEATGSITSFNGSPHSGLWAGGANFDSGTGSVVSVFKSDAGDIFVITVKGDRLTFDENSFTVMGTGFVAKNGVLLEEGNGTAWISDSRMQIRVNGDVDISGQTTSFTVK